MFDYLKPALISEGSRSGGVRRWKPRLSSTKYIMTMFYRLFKGTTDTKPTGQHSTKDLMGLAKSIGKVRINDRWYLSEITKNDSEFFKRIAVEFVP